jgi:acyl-CoA thioester hydrolase
LSMDGFNFVHEQRVTWGEMDPFNHVNNVSFFSYFENARIAYMESLGWWDKLLELNIGIIVASLQCRYRRPVTYPDTLEIGVRVERLSRDRFVLVYRLESRVQKTLVAEGESLMVSYHVVEKRKTPLPEGLREAVGLREGILNPA